MPAEIIVPRWHVVVCPYGCAKVMFRADRTDVTLTGCLEFQCRDCGERSILGGPDPEPNVTRPQVVIMREQGDALLEELHERREQHRQRRRRRG